MSRGKRYDGNQKLNLKKVIATIIVFVVLIIVIALMIKMPKNKESNGESKNITKSYITIYSDGKWGVINSKGEIVIKPSYDDMIVIPDSTQPIFIVENNVDAINGTYSSYAINEKGNKIFNDYEKVEFIQNIKSDGTTFYSENVLKTYNNGRYGLINFVGKELLPCDYDEITPIKYLVNSFETTKDGKKGIVDNAGNKIAENNYTEISGLTDKYEDGYILKNEDGKYGVINFNKQQLLDFKYDKIFNVYGSNLYVVKENGSIEIVNKDGEALCKDKFSEVKSIDNSLLIAKIDDHYNLLNSDGTQLISNNFKDLQYAFSGNYIASLDGQKYGIINVEGNKVDYNYSSITYLKEEGIIEANKDDGTTDIMDSNFDIKLNGIVSEISLKLGYLKVRIGTDYKYYNFKLEEKNSKDVLLSNNLFLSKQNGKYGFVDKNGVVIVNYIYDDATEQNEYGYSGIKKDGKWGTIDKNGKVIIDTSLSLTNNTVVSFLGKWHLATDVSANYYTDVEE